MLHSKACVSSAVASTSTDVRCTQRIANGCHGRHVACLLPLGRVSLTTWRDRFCSSPRPFSTTTARRITAGAQHAGGACCPTLHCV